MRQPLGFIRKPTLRYGGAIVRRAAGPSFASDGPAARPTVGFWQRRFALLAGFIVLACGLSPAPAAAQQSWLLVTAADAPVYDGKQVIDHVRKGYVSRLLKTSPGWLRVALPLGGRSGWVRAADARVVDETWTGLGLAGNRPASIVEAKLDVDRKTKECSVLATLPVPADRELTLGASNPSVAADEAADAHANEQTALSLERQADGIWRLAGSWQQLQATLAPGTRSLWLFDAAMNAAHRVDLPVPRFGLEVQSHRYPQLPQGIVAMLPIESLGAEFVLQYAQLAAGEPSQPPDFKPVSRIKGFLPRLLDVYRHDGRDYVRVMLPLAGSAERRVWLFRVRGADGSCSNTISAIQLGQRLNAPATQTAAAAPAPVDASVPAPAVELLGVEEAKKIVSAAGLVPRVVSQATLRPLEKMSPQALVLRQGLEPLERALAGSSLLLAVDDTVPPDNERFFPPANSPLTAADDIDVGRQFGFVALPASLQNDARQNGRTPVVDESLLAGQLAGLGLDVDFSSTAALALDADPGVLLEADVDANWAAKAALLRQTIQAVLRLPAWRQLPGPVGRAITRAIEQTDADILSAVMADDAEPIPAEQTVEVVLGELGVTLNESQRGEALAALTDAFARRRSPQLVDRNTNGRLADDVAIWLIEWLFRHDLWQPAAQTVVVADLDEEPVALFTSSPVDPAWIDRQPLPFDLPGQGLPVIQPPAAATKPAGTSTAAGAATSTTAGQEKERRPIGKPLITAGDGPDRVRVPDVIAQLVSDAYKTLVAIGLTAAQPDQLLLSDKVLAATPAAATWVDSGAAIELNIERRVPQVTGHPLLEAQNTLRRHRLRSGTTERKTFSDDRVVRQEPAAGAFVKPEATIELDVRVVVPNVTGGVLTTAKATLDKKDLKWGTATKAFNSDRVVKQSPVAGELREHGGSVELTLALAIPDVRGLTLSKASETLGQWDLQSETPNHLARSGDVVRGQTPAAGTFVPHQSPVRLGPVLGRLPDVRGMTIAAAQDRLARGEDYQVGLIGDLLSDDRVTGQAPAAGSEYERGRSITLDARVYVPDVSRQNIAAAQGQIERGGGNLRVSIDGEAWRDDVVYAQRPQGGTLVFPRASVVLAPGVYLPNLEGMSPQEAKARLSQVGVNGRITSSSNVETTNRGMVGRVVVSDQSPSPGVYRRADVNAVNLAVSRYILALRTVPGVVGDRASAAIRRIQSAGFDVTIRAGQQTFTADTYTLAAVISALGGGREFQEPTVMSQSPDGGTQAVAGSTVMIEVGGSSERRGFK
ncbi:MAG TPA: PASTA domain-containing protein [Pirellulales bacterium]